METYIVVDDFSIGLEVFDSREGSDWNVFQLVLCRVHFRNDDIRVTLLWKASQSVNRHFKRLLLIIFRMIGGLTLYLSPNSSQIGANCLQCPHQGA